MRQENFLLVLSLVALSFDENNFEINSFTFDSIPLSHVKCMVFSSFNFSVYVFVLEEN